MNRGAWQAIYSAWGHKELDMTERLQHRVVILSEVSQTEKEISHGIGHMWNLKKIRWYEWTYLQNRNRLSEDKLKGMGGRSKGVWDWHVHTTVFKMDNL